MFCWCNLESWPLESRIRSPTSDWDPESKFHWQRTRNPVPGIRIQDFQIFLDFLAKGDFFRINPLSPNIHIQILQTDLYTSPWTISWENLIKDQSIFSMVIILLILITLSLDSVWILLGENCWWSLLALKGFTPVTHRICRLKKHLTVTSENVCWSIRT